MRLESVRSLKEEIRSDVIVPLLTQDVERRSLGVRAQRLNGPVWPQTFALGVSKPGAGTEGFQLAVRVQHPMLLRSPAMEKLQKQAAGELEVRYIGSVRPLNAPWNQQRCRPVRIGCSIGHFRVTAGTLGGFVRDRATGEVCLLSNNHVLADENRGVEGDAILQPGVYDNGQNPSDRIGVLRRFVPLDFQATNAVDAAIATLEMGENYDVNLLDTFGTLRGLRMAPIQGQENVRKLGRTTGSTGGTILAIEMDNIAVGYSQGTANFNDQIEIEGAGGSAFSQGGDSGSMVIDEAEAAFGLLYAGSSTGGGNNLGLTYANPLSAVLQRLAVDLIL